MEKHKLVVPEESWGCEVSTGTRVDDIVITLWSARWLGESGGPQQKLHRRLTTVLCTWNQHNMILSALIEKENEESP